MGTVNDWVVKFLYILFLFLMGIVMLNLVIAIMADEYAQIAEKSETEYQHNLASTVLEMEVLNKKDLDSGEKLYNVGDLVFMEKTCCGGCLPTVARNHANASSMRVKFFGNPPYGNHVLEVMSVNEGVCVCNFSHEKTEHDSDEIMFENPMAHPHRSFVKLFSQLRPLFYGTPFGGLIWNLPQDNKDRDQIVAVQSWWCCRWSMRHLVTPRSQCLVSYAILPMVFFGLTLWSCLVFIGSSIAYFFLVTFLFWISLCFTRMFLPSDTEPLFSRGMTRNMHHLLTLDVSKIDPDDPDSISIFMNKETHKVCWRCPPDLELIADSPLLHLGLNQVKLMCSHIDEVVGGRVEITAAPIPSNFFHVPERDQVWKYIKFKLRSSIDQEMRFLNADQVSLCLVSVPPIVCPQAHSLCNCPFVFAFSSMSKQTLQ
jgi:hypothetical protein